MIKGKVTEIIGIYAKIAVGQVNRPHTLWWFVKDGCIDVLTTRDFYYEDVSVGDEVESLYGETWYKSPEITITVSNSSDFAPLTIQANTPICGRCGQLDVRIPRLGIWHACPSEGNTTSVPVKVEHDE